MKHVAALSGFHGHLPCILQARHDCNKNLVEIQEALLKEPTVDGQRQTAVDWPDIVACVFEEKENALLKEIKMDYLARK